MIKIFLFLALVILMYFPYAVSFSQIPKESVFSIRVHREVYREGENNYQFFRIPSLMTAGKCLLAFSEGRKNSLADHGQIDIVLKKSWDNGMTWEKMIVVTAFDDQSCQNPTPVYIQEENKIILLFTKRTVSTDTEDQIRSGTASGYMGAYMTVSRDFGKSWSEIQEITEQVKSEDWRWYAFGPGGAIRLKNPGLHRGRIIVPANHSTSGGNGNDFLGAHVIYSDNEGKTWHIGATDSEGLRTVNPNELTVAETSSGTLYFNTRSQNNAPDPLSNRAITYSPDGGNTFVRMFFHEPQLQTPVVHCSLTKTGRSFIFVGPGDPEERNNLSIWISEDESLTWKGPWLIQEGPAAYSSSVGLNKGEFGILYETGNKMPYECIQYLLVRFD